jgi:AcrR family transcriptional regulator
MAAPNDTCDKILKAASERIRHFGYAKTTMAEIAADLRMSAGNLYRFFASKLDIAEALARERREVEFKLYAAIVQRSDLSAREKLKTVLIDDAERIRATSTEQPRIVEISDIIARERPGFWSDSLAEERIYLREILNQGIANGEFEPVQDVDKLADTIQSAIYKFRSPSFSCRMSQEDLKRDLGAVLDIVLCGLAKVQARAS